MEELAHVEVQRARCQEILDALRCLARIHLNIDTPRRKVISNDPDWILHLRKVCLHIKAIIDCEVSVDGVHVMTADLRAAYEQMGLISKCLPIEFRFNDDENLWATEARGSLATFNHPTAFGLAFLPLAEGGFRDVDAPVSYLRFAVWLGRLGCGYVLAVSYLAQVMDTPSDFYTRLAEIMEGLSSCLVDTWQR